MAVQARVMGVECHVGDISIFSLKSKFDAVISLFHVISYITDSDKILESFKNINNHLHQGGIFLFDFWYSPAVYNMQPEVRIKRIENEELRITRIAEPQIHYNSNIVDVNFEVIIEKKDARKVNYINEKHPMRHFSLPEFEILATSTGFEIVEIEEWMTGDEPSENTWGVCLILRKK